MPETYEGTPNVSQASYLGFMQRYTEADAAVAEAVGERKDLRKIIKGAGINLKAFDRARKDAEKSGEVREEEDREYRRLMAWLGKPVGTQAEMFTDSPQSEEDNEAVAQHQVRRVADAGKIAGRNGADRGSNNWTPGTFLAQVWDENWLLGQEELAQTLAPSDAAPAPKRGRGRPPKEIAASAPKPGRMSRKSANGRAATVAEPKRRGRPRNDNVTLIAEAKEAMETF